MSFCWKPIHKLTSCSLLIKWHFFHYGTKWHKTQTSEFIHSTVSKEISMYLKALCCLNTFVRKEQYCVFVFLLLLAYLPSLLFLRFYLFSVFSPSISSFPWCWHRRRWRGLRLPLELPVKERSTRAADSRVAGWQTDTRALCRRVILS